MTTPLCQGARTALGSIGTWEGARPSRELVIWVFALTTALHLVENDAARSIAPGEVTIKQSAFFDVADEACLNIVDCWRFSEGTDPDETIDAETFGSVVLIALGVVFDPRLTKDRSLSNIDRIFDERWAAVWRGYTESERRMFLLVSDFILGPARASQ